MKIIHTDLTLSQIESRFYLYVIKESLFGTRGFSENNFRGKLKNSKFYIYYHPAFVKNSFSIFLIGRISETNNGCDIKYSCRKNLFFTIFMSVWLLAAACVSFSPLFSSIYKAIWYTSFIPVICIIIGVIAIFYTPKKSIARLENILNTIVIEP